MKKYALLIGLSIIAILGAFYAYNLYQSEQALSDDPLSDFAIKDTANVTMIKIKEKDLGSVTLIRDGKQWTIEELGTVAQPYNVNLILETAFQIQVKQTVPEVARENILTQMAIRHKKVEYYFNNESTPSKVWYIGNPTNDHMGTYMLLEKYDEDAKSLVKSPAPFIMHKPGVYGTLDTRFFTNLESWKFPGVFNYGVGEIKKIEVTHHTDIKSSLTINIDQKGKIQLQDFEGNEPLKYDTSSLKYFANNFRDIYYESEANELNKEQVTNIMAQTPLYSITVTDNFGHKTEARLWESTLIQQANADGQLSVDTGRALCSINGSTNLVKVQYYTWDALLKPISYFLP